MALQSLDSCSALSRRNKIKQGRGTRNTTLACLEEEWDKNVTVVSLLQKALILVKILKLLAQHCLSAVRTSETSSAFLLLSSSVQ